MVVDNFLACGSCSGSTQCSDTFQCVGVYGGRQTHRKESAWIQKFADIDASTTTTAAPLIPTASPNKDELVKDLKTKIFDDIKDDVRQKIQEIIGSLISDGEIEHQIFHKIEKHVKVKVQEIIANQVMKDVHQDIDVAVEDRLGLMQEEISSLKRLLVDQTLQRVKKINRKKFDSYNRLVPDHVNYGSEDESGYHSVKIVDDINSSTDSDSPSESSTTSSVPSSSYPSPPSPSSSPSSSPPPPTQPNPTSSTTAGSINILSATYGPNCPGVTSNNDKLISTQCNKQFNCTYLINYLVIGDPAVGCAKDYFVNYTCHDHGKVRDVNIPGEATGKSIDLSCAK